MSIDEWFHQPPSSNVPPKPEEAQALQNFLAGTISVHTAAERFTAVTASAGNNSEEVGKALTRMWKFVMDLAQDFPETQDKIVELLAEIEKLPDLEHDGHTVIYHGMKVWSDLPTFGWEMRDRWNYFDPPPGDPNQTNSRLKWLSINAFAARITACQCAAEFQMFGLWSLREALEEGSWNEDGRLAEDSSDEVQSTLDGSVPAAAQWIFHAGRAIFACDEQVEPSPQGGDPMRGGALWNGKSGFSKERWSLWKKRFEWVQGVGTLAASTKEMAKEVVEAMEQIEKDAHSISG